MTRSEWRSNRPVSSSLQVGAERGQVSKTSPAEFDSLHLCQIETSPACRRGRFFYARM